MARFKVRSFSEAGKTLTKIVGRKNRLYLSYTWLNLVQKTPVLTYTASNSWIVSGGFPSTRVPVYKNYGNRPGLPAYLSSDVAFNFTFGKYSNWYIVNNQKYMVYLERGNSVQAPAGWIAFTINQMTRIANSGGF